MSADNQEPVAWLCEPDKNGMYGLPLTEGTCAKCFPVYRHPPQRKPLTDEQRKAISKGWQGRNWTVGDIIDAIEAAHGIKE